MEKKRLLIIAQKKYYDVAKNIAESSNDFSVIEHWEDIQDTQFEKLSGFENILLCDESRKIECWKEKLVAFERKLLFLSITTISGMPYRVKVKPKMPDDYKFDEVM